MTSRKSFKDPKEEPLKEEKVKIESKYIKNEYASDLIEVKCGRANSDRVMRVSNGAWIPGPVNIYNCLVMR